MSGLREVAFTSDSSGHLWNTCVWDPHVGTTLMTYKGGISNSRCLSLIGRDFLISADAVKPLFHFWALNRQEQIQVRMVCPGKVSALAISPDGAYCVCGIEEKIHVWQVTSGRLMAVISRHFQRVTCVRFTDDASHFATAAEDGLVLVWPLCKVVSKTQNLFRAIADVSEPRYTLSDHSLTITDLLIGRGGMRARLLTASLDGTTKMYDLASGLMLLSLVFDVGLTCITMTSSESHVFLGAVDGNIYHFFPQKPPRNLDYFSETEKQNVFTEHLKSITCLSVSSDGLLLMSGSLDEQVIFWDIHSMQCLRKLQHKGPISNAFFSIVPTNVFSNDLKHSVVLSSFKRKGDIENEENFVINILNSEKVLNDAKPMNLHDLFWHSSSLKLEEEVERVKKCNKELYGFIVTDILGATDEQNISLKPNDKEKTPIKPKMIAKTKKLQ